MFERLVTIGVMGVFLAGYIFCGVTFFLPGNDDGGVHNVVAMCYWILGWAPGLCAGIYMTGAFDD